MDQRLMTLVTTTAGTRWELLEAGRNGLKAGRAVANMLCQNLPEGSPEGEEAKLVAESISRLIRLLSPPVAAPSASTKPFPGNCDRQLPAGDRLEAS